MSAPNADDRTLEYYLTLHYPIQITPRKEDGESYWFAEIPDLPGCMSHGATPDEAVQNVNEAKALWIETQLADGNEVPEPSHIRGFSGRVLLRLPKGLHRRLAWAAQQEDVSLNQYIVNQLMGLDRSADVIRRLEHQVNRLMEQQESIQRYLEWAPEMRRLIFALRGSHHYSSLDPTVVYTGPQNEPSILFPDPVSAKAKPTFTHQEPGTLPLDSALAGFSDIVRFQPSREVESKE